MPELTKSLKKPAYFLDTEAFVDEVARVIEMLTKYAEDSRGEQAKELESIRLALQSLKEEIKAGNTNEVADIKKMVDSRLNKAIATTEELVRNALRQQEIGMSFIHDKVNSLQDGEDGEDRAKGKDADEERVASIVTGSLRALFEEEFKKLREDIQALKSRPVGRSGGVFGPSVIVKTLFNQSFPQTPDGVITAFTLAKAPRYLNAERIYQNGVRLRPGSSNDYTVAGKTVTFTTAPATGDIIVYDLEY